MRSIHWLGAGLSSVPGIRRLAASDASFVCWNRTRSKAVAALDGTAGTARELDWAALAETVQPGDILVSMLPADHHLRVAELGLRKGAHFVSSSYISEDMQACDTEAKTKGLCLVNEVGLDPGIDHLMAHALVADYRDSGACDPNLEHRFTSYCGGFPAEANDFRYKFSWSPLGVLRALKTPARWIEQAQPTAINTPWKALSSRALRLPGGTETFEAYPNRDSLPFAAVYGLGAEVHLVEFVRGTLRLEGWAEAWRPIFAEIEQSIRDADDTRLVEVSQELWDAYTYTPGEADRVVLHVALDVRDGDRPVWNGAYALDAGGNETGSAMARLVSKTVAIAVEAVLSGHIPPGISDAPSQPEMVRHWMNELIQSGEAITPM